MDHENHKYIVREGWISILVNLLFFGLKYWAGIVSGSIALIADAWHTLTDSISSIIVIIGGKISKKPADDDHPYGHGRAQHIAAIIIGVLLAVIAFDFILGSIDKFRKGESGNFGAIAIWVTIVSIIAKETMAQYAFWAYRKTGFSVLRADAWHHRADSLSSAIILGGIFIGKYFWWIDSALGFVVALMIAWASYEILSREINNILGVKISGELTDQIISEVSKLFDFEVYMHNFNLHNYGSHKELSCHIRLKAEMSLEEAHFICSEIEKTINEKFDIVATIHPEPLNSNPE